MIAVIYNKGDATNPEPIRGLPLHKLFSTMLFNRLYAVLDRSQCADQAGFRNKFQTKDHPVTYKLMSPKSREWGTDVWVAAIVFKKAFDSVQHEAIWRSFRNHSNCALNNAPPY